MSIYLKLSTPLFFREPVTKYVLKTCILEVQNTFSHQNRLKTWTQWPFKKVPQILRFLSSKPLGQNTYGFRDIQKVHVTARRMAFLRRNPPNTYLVDSSRDLKCCWLRFASKRWPIKLESESGIRCLSEFFLLCWFSGPGFDSPGSWLVGNWALQLHPGRPPEQDDSSIAAVAAPSSQEDKVLGPRTKPNHHIWVDSPCKHLTAAAPGISC